jgi:dipeptidyl-peptidase-3
MEQDVTIQHIKQRFYAMRNGIIADTMRRVGAPYRMIFGVNLPQLTAIAASIEPNASLAEQLWSDSTTRESVLLAPMVMPADSFTIDTARRWIATAPSNEAIDVLCLKLLSRMPYLAELATALAADESQSDLTAYTAARIRHYQQ